MTINECEICGVNGNMLIGGIRELDLQTVDVTSTCEEGTSWDAVTACAGCLDAYKAFKIVNVTENGVTSSGWIIDDPRLYFKFFRV